MPIFRFMRALRSFWLVLALFAVAQASAQEDATSAQSGSSFEPFNQSYIDANFGLANIDGEFVFPGVSFLVGKRMFVSQRFFLDGQLGLAFPSILTAKLGAGVRNPANGWSVAAGLRPWPTHWYLQVGREDRRCSDDVKPRVARRLKRRGKDPSDILCGEWIFSIEASAWLIDRLKVGKTPWRYHYGMYDSNAYGSSMTSAAMVTWSHRWYLH